VIRTAVEIKAEIRRAMIDAILSMPAERRRAEDEALFDDFASLPGLSTSKTVLLYLSAFAEEMPTHRLFVQARAMGKQILLPRVSRRPRRLRLFEVHNLDADLEVVAMGISEPRLDLPEHPPESVDWALIPGLAFDRRGYRVGRGGGYYDRLLPRLRPDAVCWALGYDCQLIEGLPHEDHDAPLDGVAVPSGRYPGSRHRYRSRPDQPGRSGRDPEPRNLGE
jgi:5-formyltetrahydrofolate cyclo-ligase